MSSLPAQKLALREPPQFAGLFHQIVIWSLLILPFMAFVIGCLFFWGWFGFFMIIALHLWRGFGVTVGFHRLLTHRSFKCKQWLYYALAIQGMSAWQGTCINWLSVHRIHHLFSDQEGDPHSPHVDPSGKPWKSNWGFWHSHYWWFRNSYPKEQLDRVAKRELRDPILVRLSSLWWLWGLLSLIIPALIGGVYFTMVGGSFSHGALQGLIASGASIFFVGHSTFSINSVCHLVGYRPFVSDDEARNVPLLAYFTLGESYHHNHHVWQSMAFHGMKWYRDPSEMYIRGLMLLGLAWDPTMPTPEQIAAARRDSQKVSP